MSNKKDMSKLTENNVFVDDIASCFEEEINMVVDIIGDSLVSGVDIIKKLEKTDMDFGPRASNSNSNLSIDLFLEILYDLKVIRYNPGINIASVIFVENSYILSIPYLREYKLRKIIS